MRTGDSYAWTGHFNTNVTGTANGLNQLTSVGPKNLTHDARGNVTAFGTKSFTYSSENLLLTGPGSTTLSYDPGMRLHQAVSGATTLRFAYDGLDRIAEYNGSNALQRRFVHGPGMDQSLVQYEGSGTSGRRFLSSDERGSIISLTDSSGALLGINKYDEFGNPQAGNLGAFGYTGQAWLQGINVWYYKARAYDSELGRFLQTDPIGHLGGLNLYAYVSNDPVNLTDPLGLGSFQPGTICAPHPMANAVCAPSGEVPVRIGGGNAAGNAGGDVSHPRPGRPRPTPERPQRPDNGEAVCPPPATVKIAGTLHIYGGSAAFGTFSGTLTDPSSGRAYSFSTQVGVGGGFGVGRFYVSGTVPGFGSLDAGFGLAFVDAGYKGLGFSLAKLHSLGSNETIGSIEITPFILSPPLGAADIGFKHGATRELIGAGNGC